MPYIDPSLYNRLGGKAAVDAVIEVFYDKMQDDYRLNRFFNSSEHQQQKNTLKALVSGLLDGSCANEERFSALLEDFFLTCFARDKRKSFVGGNDWGFFGYIIEQDHPSTKYLCDSHSHLLKFMPTDEHYDAVLEHLNAALQESSLSGGLKNEVLALAEQAKNPVLGK
jgi:hemoglobin